MKSVMHGNKGDGASGILSLHKDRRKAYYHGKYHREILTMLLLLVCLGILFFH